MEPLAILIIHIIGKVGVMESLSQIQAHKDEESDFFGIEYNFRKTERSRRKKLLKKYKLKVEQELRNRNLKQNAKTMTKSTEIGQSQDEQPFLWDVLNEECFDFKFSCHFLMKEDSIWIESEKTEESSQ